METPLLGRGGVAAPYRKWPRSLAARTGWLFNRMAVIPRRFVAILRPSGKVKVKECFQSGATAAAMAPRNRGDPHWTNHPVRAVQRNGTIGLMARPPLLGQGGESAFPTFTANVQTPGRGHRPPLQLLALRSVSFSGHLSERRHDGGAVLDRDLQIRRARLAQIDLVGGHQAL